MARCGCSNTCSCSVIAGTNTTVTGTGSAADPYVINAAGASVQANDTNTVNHTLTGTGTMADPYILTSQVIVDPVAGNQLVAGPAGLSVPAPTVTTADTPCIAVNGDGSAGSPITAVPIIDPVVGNQLSCGPNGLVVAAAGAGVTVTDTNTVDLTATGVNPTDISADVIVDPVAGNTLVAGPAGLSVPCEAIQDCVGQGFVNGLEYLDGANQFQARIDPVVGNNITQTAAGLFVPTGAATVTTADTPCIAVNGDGSAGLPITALPIFDPAAGNLLSCEAGGLRADLSTVDTPCINITGSGTPASPLQVDPIIDPAVGNTLSCGPAGLLVTASPVVTALCGLEGNGTLATPLAANVAAWPFACDQNTFAQGVYCNPVTGELQSPPAAATDCDQININTTVPATAIPAAPVNISSETLNYTNPSTCRPAVVLIEAEADVDFNVAVGSIVSMYQAGDEMYQVENTGGSVMSNVHTQTTKVACFALAPGASGSFTQNIEVDESVGGGSTYTRVQSIIRAFIFSV